MEARKASGAARGGAKGSGQARVLSDRDRGAAQLPGFGPGPGQSSAIPGNCFQFGCDLFGMPMLPPVERRGRPAHQPTARQRRKVAQLHQAGVAQPIIAKAIGITVPTLVRHYPEELESKSLARSRWKGECNDGNQ